MSEGWPVSDHQLIGIVLVVFVLSVLTLELGFSAGHKKGYDEGSKHFADARGYVGCKDGKLTMKNFFVDSVRSEAFHFGVDPCGEHGQQGAITMHFNRFWGKP
jgi:hypothetical protein